MADIQVLIEVIGEQDMVKATRTATRMTNEYKTLDRALSKGKISQVQYAAGVQQVDNKIEAMTAAARQNTNAINAQSAAVNSASSASRTYGQSTGLAGKQTNRMGVFAQQAGFQVGDFVVQVQSGANVMMAFGQQATQIIGTMASLSKTMRGIAFFSVLGVVVPIVTAIAGAFMRMEKETKDTAKAVDELSKSVSGYSSAVDVLNKSQSELTEEFGTFSGYAVAAANALKKIALNEINEQVETLSNRFTDVSNLMGRQIPSSINKTVRDFLELNAGISENNRLVAEFINSQIALSRAEGPKQQAEALNNLMELYVSLVGEQEGMTEEQEAYYLSLVQSLEQLSKFGAEQEGVTKDTKEQAEAQEQINDLLDKGRSAVLERNRNFYQAGLELDRQLKLTQAEIKYGKESLEVVKLRAKQEAILRGYTQNQIDDYVDQVVEIKKVKDEAEELDRTLDNTFRNRTVMYSIRFAGEETVMSQPVMQTPKAPEMPSYKELRGMGWTDEDIKAMGVNVPRKSVGGDGGVGRDPAEDRARAREALQSLIAQYDEGVAEAQKLSKAQETINEAVRNGVITTEQGQTAMQGYIQSLEDTKNPMADFVDNFAKQMADAFTSIVDGSKAASDAFKDMARSILEQAFRMAVVNPIINSIFGGVSGFTKLPSFFANGAAFSGGKVTAFANGGVVNGPTVFPMANGMGLMGEAGPEAVMPLKRGKNGKLGVQADGGGQQPVVINQSFNFSANGDDSVKRIIAQEAPRIANLTQKQILDQRRRGGVMKSTFG